MKRKIKFLIILIILVLIGFVAQEFYVNGTEEIEKGTMSYSEFSQAAKENKIDKIKLTSGSNFFHAYYKKGFGIEEDKEKLTLEDNQRVEKIILPRTDDFIKGVSDSGIEIVIAKKSRLYNFMMNLISALPLIIIVSVLLYYILVVVSGKMGGFGQNKLSSKNKKIKLEDVVGLEEEKKEIMHEIEVFMNPKKYKKMGVTPSGGILLTGPPGVGKTYLTMAIANKVDAKFYYFSGSDFVEMFSGLGGKRVRKVYAEAVKNKPAIIFIDEIDAVGQKRNTGISDGGSREADQTLVALLERMDGVSSEEGVIFIGATNRFDILDKALVRPGRFDKVIQFNGPQSKEEREEIVKLYLKNKKVEKNVTVEEITKHFFGLSPAEIKAVLEDAVNEAIKNGKEGVIGLKEIDSAFMKRVTKGVSKGRHLMEDLKRVSIHETGHALMNRAIGREVMKVSVEPYSNGMGGVTTVDGDSKGMSGLRTKTDIRNDIKVLLAGKIAEEVMLGECSVGSRDDLKKATELLKRYVGAYGMKDDSILALYTIGQENKLITSKDKMLENMEEVAQEIKKEVLSFFNKNEVRHMVWHISKKLEKDEVIYNLEEVIKAIQK